MNKLLKEYNTLSIKEKEINDCIDKSKNNEYLIDYLKRFFLSTFFSILPAICVICFSSFLINLDVKGITGGVLLYFIISLFASTVILSKHSDFDEFDELLLKINFKTKQGRLYLFKMTLFSSVFSIGTAIFVFLYQVYIFFIFIFHILFLNLHLRKKKHIEDINFDSLLKEHKKILKSLEILEKKILNDQTAIRALIMDESINDSIYLSNLKSLFISTLNQDELVKNYINNTNKIINKIVTE